MPTFYEICPICEGSGQVVDFEIIAVPICCGHPTNTGECCGNPESGLEEIETTHRCDACSGLGSIGIAAPSHGD